MEPKYRDGDWLLVGVGWPITPDCVVLAWDPRKSDRLLVKRAIRWGAWPTTRLQGEGVEGPQSEGVVGPLGAGGDSREVGEDARPQGEGWWVEGDNDAHSTDSRQFGLLTPDLIVGRVLLRYHRPGTR